MPTPQAILAGLRLATNDTRAVAVLWHLVAAAALVALSRGWRPSERRAGFLLATPILSAAVVALLHGNPFNGGLLGILAVALGALAGRLDLAPVRRSSSPFAGAGLALIAFGLWYPHFLDGPAALYVVAAPTGLIPCPTLSLVIGFALLAGGLQSRVWSIVLAAAGLFYGLFGVVRLGVVLDLGLIAGAAALLVAALRPAVGGRRRE